MKRPPLPRNREPMEPVYGFDDRLEAEALAMARRLNILEI
jgi:hypothetical protein